MKTKVLFRADASRQIGYGHFVRSLALAGRMTSTVFYVPKPLHRISGLRSQKCAD